MSAPIGPGDFVECVDASITPGCGPHGLVAGRIYLVLAVEAVPPGFRDAGSPGLLIDGASPTTNECGIPIRLFRPERFRPLYRPSADLIESLKAPPQRVKEDA